MTALDSLAYQVCTYCGEEIGPERVLRGLQANTAARYCGPDCAKRAKNQRARHDRASKRVISDAEVRTALLQGERAPEFPRERLTMLAHRFGKSLAKVAAEAGLPSNQPIYAYMSGKQMRLSQVTRMRLHLYFLRLEKEHGHN